MISSHDLPAPEVSRPHRAVAGPQPDRSRAWLAVSTLAGIVCAGAATSCEAASDAQVTAPFAVAIGQNEMPSYSDAELTLYESQTPVPFPVKKPTAADLAALKGNASPYPRPPYLLASNETIEVNYTITNLDNESHTVWLLLDPWNEFVKYRPGVTVVSDDETEPNLSGIEQPFLIGPLQRIQGNIQASDMSILALKLDTAMKIVQSTFTMDSAYGAGTLLNHDFNTQNYPGPSDPLLAPYTPTVVAGLTGFDLGLQSYEPVNVELEVTVNVQDTGTGKIAPPGTTSGLIGEPPAVLTIPGAMP